MEWRVLKANADTEREHLNRILAEIQAATSGGGGGGGSTAWGDITGTLSNQTDLQSALNAKANSSHTHTTSEITNLSSYTGFDSRYYTEGETDTLLSGKENSFSKGNLIQGTGVTLTGTLTGRLVGSGDVTIAASAGSDPWTYSVLASDFSTTLTSLQTTAMTLSIPLNVTFEFEALLLLSSVAATTGARPGIDWGSGISYGGSYLQAPNTATANVIANTTAGAPGQAAATSMPAANFRYLGIVKGLGRTQIGSGTTLTVLLASEVAGSQVTVSAGSFIKYRTI